MAQMKPAATAPPPLVWPGQPAPAAQPKAAGHPRPQLVWPGRTPPAAQPKAAASPRLPVPPSLPLAPCRPAPPPNRVVQAAKKVKGAKKKDGVERLKRSNTRNLTEKAKPKNERALFSSQQKHSYGYDHSEIEEGFVEGSFKPFFGGQPKLTAVYKGYKGPKMNSDYDSLIQVIETAATAKEASEAEIAKDILRFIYSKMKPTKDKYSPKTLLAMSYLIQLTQFIESHNTRVPGADKWARACFKRIRDKGSTFRGEFNRKDGNFLPARAKAKEGKPKLSTFGGQQSTRGLLGLVKKKDDKVEFADVASKMVLESLLDLSESSGDEDN